MGKKKKPLSAKLTVKELLSRANAGEIDAYRLLGYKYDNAIGVKRSPAKARQFFEKAAEKGNAGAMFSLGVMYFRDDGVEQDKSKARDYWEKAADKDDVDAMFILGAMYNEADGVEEDKSKARDYWEKAAEKDDADAMVSLGVRYFQGDGVEQDKSKARDYWEKAAEKDNAEAMFNLGVMYFKDVGVEQDKSKAKQYWEQAAEKGHAGALFCLGAMYNEADGVEEDKRKAREQWEEAAKKGDAGAMDNLGVMYDQGDGVEEDKSKARDYWEKAAGKEHAGAMVNLGVMCLKGDDDEQKIEKSRYWWEKAALRFQPRALLLLGLMYQHGVDVSKDPKRAKPYIETAANYAPEYRRFLGLLREVEPAGHDGKTRRRQVLELADYLVDLDETASLVMFRLDRKLRKKLSDARKEDVEGAKIDAESSRRRRASPNVLAHYTLFDVIPAILPVETDSGEKRNDANRLRLSNMLAVNDPSEGLALAHFSRDAMSNYGHDYYLHHFFPENLERNRESGYEDMVYCASFSEPKNEPKEIDSLNLWRFYGGNGRGACLVIPAACFTFADSSTDFRLGGDQRSLEFSTPSLAGIDPANQPSQTDRPTSSTPPPVAPPENRPPELKLRRVFYGDSEKKEMLEALRPLLEKVYEIKKAFTDPTVPPLKAEQNAKRIDQAVKLALLDVLFLFKNDEYEQEREWRLIEIRPIGSENVRMQTGKDGRPQFFLETDPFLFKEVKSLEKCRIILGPAMEHAADKRLEVKYRLHQNDYKKNVDVKISEIPFQ